MAPKMARRAGPGNGDWILRLRPLAWWLWALFFLNLFVRGDGYFVLPRTIDPEILRAIALGQTIILLVTGACLVGYVLVGAGADPPDIGNAGVLAMVLGSVALVVALDLAQARRFADVGYATRYPALVAVCGGFPGRAAHPVAPVAARRDHRLGRRPQALPSRRLSRHGQAIGPTADHRPGTARSMVGSERLPSFVLDNGVLTPNVRFPGLIAAYLPSLPARR